MSDDTTIQPALTPGEWSNQHFSVGEVFGAGVDNCGDFHVMLSCGGNVGTGIELDAHRRHALAALALHGQPFGFTEQEVTAVRESAEDDHAAYEHHATLRIVAAKIAALLPRAPGPKHLGGVSYEEFLAVAGGEPPERTAEDTARLEWLESHRCELGHWRDEVRSEVVVYQRGPDNTMPAFRGSSIREAIDAAMKAAPPEPR